MNSIVKWFDKLPFSFLLTAAMTGILFLVPLFTIGTFDDGIFYACISRNLATEPGENIWILKVSNALDPHFHGHPPLAFWLQALFFKVLGDHFWIEKLYGLIMAVFSFYLMGKIILLLSPKRNGHSFIFIILFIPVIFWSFGNNMLENTLVVFILISVYCYLKSQEKKHSKYLFLCLTAFFIFCGFLTKGPVALFLCTLPFSYHLIRIRSNFINFISETIVLIVFSISFFLLLYFFNDDAQSFFNDYFELQIKGSLTNQGNFSSRFVIIKCFFQETIIVHLFILIVLLITRKSKSKPISFNHNNFFLLLLFLMSSLPFMISSKQFGHYLVPSYFFYISFLILHFEERFAILYNFSVHLMLFRIFKFASILLIFLSLLISIFNFGEHNRYKNLFSELDKISKYVGNHSEILIDNKVYEDWKVHAYLYRYYYIDLSTVYKKQEFALSYDLSKPEIKHSFEFHPDSCKSFIFLKHKTK